MKREDYIKGITNYLGQVDSTIKIRNAIDLYDLNIIAESFFCELLNQVYGYCLLNKNTIVKHAPAIDLEDSINGVFVQVTSNNTRDKINKTLEKFIGNSELDINNHYRLIVLIIGKTKKQYKPFVHNPNIELIIMDTTDMVKHIANNVDLEHLSAIYNYLSKEFEKDKVSEAEHEYPQLDFISNSEFTKDRNAIVTCSAFKTLKDKSLLITIDQNDYKALDIALEIAKNSRSIGEALSLDQALIETIAFGKYLGKPPFGFAAERVLNMVNPYGFNYLLQSVRIIKKLANNGKGLGVSQIVCDEIEKQRIHQKCKTQEGEVVRICSMITNVHIDMSIGLKKSWFSEENIPDSIRLVLGNSEDERYLTLLDDLVRHSLKEKEVSNSQEVQEALLMMMRFLFENCYNAPINRKRAKAKGNLIEGLYYYYLQDQNLVPSYLLTNDTFCNIEQAVSDYIVSLSETETINQFNSIYYIG